MNQKNAKTFDPKSDSANGLNRHHLFGRSGEDAQSKCSGLASILIFLGESMNQANTNSGLYTFSDQALEGWSRLCIDVGYELLDLAEPLALWTEQQSQP